MNFHRRNLGLVSVAPLALFALACGSAPPPPAPAPMANNTATMSPPIDLSPVPEPSGLVAIAHLSKPSAVIKTVGAWVNLPMVNAASLLSMVENEDVAKVLDLSQPVDAIVTATGQGMAIKPQVAGAVGIKSFNDAKATFSAHHKLVAGANGSFRVVGLSKKNGDADENDKDVDDDEDTPCAIAPSSGGSGGRLVCADSIASLDASIPYLTRTAPRATYTNDLHIEVRTQPLHSGIEALRALIPMVASRMAKSAIGSSGSDSLKQLGEAGLNDLADFGSDLQKMSLDLNFNSDDATITVVENLATKTSLMANLLTSHPERADAPPAAFWKLPADATSGGYRRTTSPEDVAHARELLKNALLAFMESNGIAEADRRAVADALHDVIDRALEIQVNAHGVDSAAVESAEAAVKAADPKKRGAADHALIETLTGWSVMATDTPAPKVVATAREAIAAWNRPGVAKWVKVASADTPLPKITVHDAAAPKGTPKGTTQFVIEVSNPPPAPSTSSSKSSSSLSSKMTPLSKATKPIGASLPLFMHVLIVPDGAQTWVVFTGNEALAATEAKLVTSASPDATLAKRPGFEAFHDAKTNGAFFITPLALSERSSIQIWMGQQPIDKDPFRGVADSADKGMTPIVATTTTLPPSKDAAAGSNVLSAKVPRAVVEDLVKLAMRGFR